MSATTAADAKIDRAQLEQIMEMLDRDKDGKVTADEFKVPWLKLFPKLKDADFQEAWKKIDANGDGILTMDELATAAERLRPLKEAARLVAIGGARGGGK